MYPSLWNAALNIWRNRMAWFHRGSEDEDKVVAEVAAMLLEGVSDADDVAKVAAQHGRNRRDQLTVEEAEELYAEGRLRNFGFRRN